MIKNNNSYKSKIINGREFAEKMRQEISQKIIAFKQKYNLTPGLAVILVGEDPASKVYVSNKGKQTIEAGMNSFEYLLPEKILEEDLLRKIAELNSDDRVHGILVQLPLPKHISEFKVINSIAPQKDVDGFHLENVGKLSVGQQGLIPCTPKGCLMLIKATLGDLTGLHAVVIGRSNIVGKPMAQLLLRENCTVTIAHSRTKDLAGVCRKADILVSAVGVEQMVRGEWIKLGATVIDVGINRAPASDGNYKLVGDINFDEVVKIASHVTPVPGGVGPMTIACLLENTLLAACNIHNITLDEIVSYEKTANI